MMTAMERSISPYEERGSEVTMEDSLRLKQRKENAGFSDLGVQYAPGTESGTANGEISESGVRQCKGHLVLILSLGSPGLEEVVLLHHL